MTNLSATTSESRPRRHRVAADRYSSDSPRATYHVRDRWIQYVDDFDTTDPELEWQDGLKLYDHGLDAEEARYLPDYDVILCRKQANLTTVINNDGNLRWQAREAIQVATFCAGLRAKL